MLNAQPLSPARRSPYGARWLLVWLVRADIARLTRELAVQRAALAQARVRPTPLADSNADASACASRAALDMALAQSGIKASAID
jgi:hypothetical protein